VILSKPVEEFIVIQAGKIVKSHGAVVVVVLISSTVVIAVHSHLFSQSVPVLLRVPRPLFFAQELLTKPLKRSLHRKKHITMLHAPSKNNMSNIRDLFARDHREKVPPDLRQALTLLQLNGYEDLEERFLSTDAFLRPWSVFRDSIFLKSPDAMPHATQVIPIGTASGNGVSRLDILWFYTQFDEGTLRYDSRADRHSTEYTPDTSVYGVIDKSKWRVEEHEKHLYSWLLQEFKVGKGYSPWRYEFFELKNVCTVWEEVLVPIVSAVRASYNPLGRQHYGRLALFIETRCPSQLAFPDSNVAVPEDGLLSPTPYRIVSVPKKVASSEVAHGMLSRKHYDATEKELRDVYPQYGGLVERPKFKHKMEEWLSEQRARANQRKGHEQHGQVRAFQPHIVRTEGSQTSMIQDPMGGVHRQQSGSGGPIKRCADSIKRSLSNKISSLKLKEEQKSPLHGVTRQLHFLDRSSSHSYDHMRESMLITPLPRPQMQDEPSGESTYTSIRNSNPFDLQWLACADSDNSMFSPMGQLSAIPRPLQAEHHTITTSSSSRVRPKHTVSPSELIDDEQSSDQPGPLHDLAPSKKEHISLGQERENHGIRMPSYEGTEYQKEISLTDLHTKCLKSVRSSEPVRSRTPATRLPAPIIPIPYSGPRVASADTPGKSPPKPPAAVSSKPVVAPPKPVVWPGPAPKTTAWPGFDSDDDNSPPLPPIPSKAPERQIHNPRSRQPLRDDAVDKEVSRIVSRENIRAALSSVSRESSAERLVPQRPFPDTIGTTSPLKEPLHTYNTHLFPRKGTPVEAWVNAKDDKGRSYELEVLKDGKSKDMSE
jgi:hypothetical protein